MMGRHGWWAVVSTVMNTSISLRYVIFRDQLGNYCVVNKKVSGVVSWLPVSTMCVHNMRT
jgi:hypothetical protein